MKNNTNQDQLLQSFTDFQMPKGELNTAFGGSTSGHSEYNCGSSSTWFDLPNGGCLTLEDAISCD